VTTMPSTESAWREVLRPDQYAVLRQSATERPFHGEYVDTDDDGTYRCAGCRAPLFSSGSKYHSGSGWPSFTEPMDDATVDLVPDLSHGMVRTEIRCATCGGHLGHVFDDGPRDRGGQRYCINSCALDLHRGET
jgi:peptide-methionine (R)-S-oxide reductase